MMRFILSLFLCIPAWAAPQVFTMGAALPEGTIAQEILEYAGQAVGFVEIKGEKTNRRVQTGFFYRPNLFVTVRHPHEKELPDCGQMKIYTSPDIVRRTKLKGEEEYQCVDILQGNARYGFYAIQVNRETPQFIPLMKSASRAGLKDGEERYAVGYSREAIGFISRGCKIERGECKFCERAVNTPIQKGVWSEADCFYRSGMAGGPILAIDPLSGKWQAIAMVGPLVEGSSDFYSPSESLIFHHHISAVKFGSIMQMFGEDLLGAE